MRNKYIGRDNSQQWQISHRSSFNCFVNVNYFKNYGQPTAWNVQGEMQCSYVCKETNIISKRCKVLFKSVWLHNALLKGVTIFPTV